MNDSPAAPNISAFTTLLSLAAIIFFGFMTIGMPLPVIPVYVNQTLGFGSLMVGIAVGLQSVVTLLLRSFAGHTVDTRGAKYAVLKGLCGCVAAGVLYRVSAAFADQSPTLALIILLSGRAVLGFAESLILTGGMTWGIGLLGPAHASRAISWQGISMYTAIAVGAPAGAALLQRWGFISVAYTVIVLPLIAILVALALPPAKPMAGTRLPFIQVIGRVWRPGLAMTLGSIGYAVIAAFITLFYASRGWSDAAYALTAYSLTFIGMRLLFGDAVKRFGGARVAAGSLLIEAVGQGLLWSASSPTMAVIGAALTGIGFSLVFPALGVEAIKNVPHQNRGAALAAYSGFFDLGLGLIGPLAGLVVGAFGYETIFLCGAASAIIGAFLAGQFDRRNQRDAPSEIDVTPDPH
ncbi:MFS transporter [Herbaspirillum autotrophicum]|uniref:MFS transporter n=1 Tax=Herbaspirillum autotrophicum TaxID=180195 RepID=UPI00067DFD08|nr:MFS transporter [Herbaspirillum autotrophicum]